MPSEEAAPFFSEDSFFYDRRYPPLFFHEPKTKKEDRKRVEAMYKMSREYFRLGSQPGSTHHTTMPIGLTLGEYAMYLCIEKNYRRQSSHGET